MPCPNLPFATPLDIANELLFIPGKAQSKIIFQNENMTVSFLAVAAGESLSARESPGEVLAEVLQGKAKITVGDKALEVNAGQIVILPRGLPHTLLAIVSFKMLHTLVFAPEDCADSAD